MRLLGRSRLILGALLSAAAIVLIGCSIEADTSIAPGASTQGEGGSTDTIEITIDPAAEWVETLSTRPSDPSIARTISPDGNWLATAGRDVCIHSLGRDPRPICVSDPTLGPDSLSWSADSTMLVTGGSTSGRWNSTGVWTLSTDGALTAVSPVDEGNFLSGERDGVIHTAMAFGPDDSSIVYTRWAPEGVEIGEIALDGGDTQVLLEIEPGDVGISTHLPLADGRVLVNTGVVEGGVDLLDGGILTRLIERPDDELPGSVPIALDASVTSDEFADGVALVVSWRGAGRGFDKNSWWLVDFAGNEFPLITPENQNVVTATLSPDGNHVAYVTYDPLTDPERPAFELHVIELSAVVDGAQPLGSHLIEDPAAANIRGFGRLLDFHTMRWAPDNRVLVALDSADEAPVLEIDLSPSAR